jgi:hypothetical protein
MLKFHRDGEGYTATLADGNLYHIKKVQRILLGRFGGGTVYTFWQVEFVEPDERGRIGCASLGGKRTKILAGSKYAPEDFTTKLPDTKKLCVIAANAHANGANNMEKK